MPNSIRYHIIQNAISTPRIETYRKFFDEHSTEEIYGIYLWNKTLCGAIYPLLQACEVALRNAINTPAVERFGPYWYEAISHTKHHGNDNYNYTNLVGNFERARDNVVKKLNKQLRSNGRRLLRRDYRPDFNLVVAATDFSTWEYALHTCHYRVNNNNYLWPKQTKKSFKNWPYQSSSDTQIELYDIVSELRPFRNRLSHHEPLWKGISVTTEEEALAYVNQKIDKIESLIAIISDEKAKYLNVQNLLIKARYTASKDMLDRCRYRSKGQQFTLKRKNKLRTFLRELSASNTPKIIEFGGAKFLIEAL
ncbi:Abi family protein [Vibrio alginolyticus]